MTTDVIHHPDGMEATYKCCWTYKLPSGKLAYCDAPAFWELIIETGVRWGGSHIPLHTYRCDLHHTPDEGTA